MILKQNSVLPCLPRKQAWRSIALMREEQTDDKRRTD